MLYIYNIICKTLLICHPSGETISSNQCWQPAPLFFIRCSTFRFFLKQLWPVNCRTSTMLIIVVKDFFQWQNSLLARTYFELFIMELLMWHFFCYGYEWRLLWNRFYHWTDSPENIKLPEYNHCYILCIYIILSVWHQFLVNAIVLVIVNCQQYHNKTLLRYS